MKRVGAVTFLAALAIGLACPSAFAQADATLVVRGAVVTPGQWSTSDIKKQFADQVQPVTFTGKDNAQHVGSGIPLVSLLLKAGPKTEPTIKHHELTFMVVVEARDSYRVFFSLAELLPTVGHAQAYLVWDMDGKPLPGKEAPFRLIVTSDREPDRHIYAITSITLVDGTKVVAQSTRR